MLADEQIIRIIEVLVPKIPQLTQGDSSTHIEMLAQLLGAIDDLSEGSINLAGLAGKILSGELKDADPDLVNLLHITKVAVTINEQGLITAIDREQIIKQCGQLQQRSTAADRQQKALFASPSNLSLVEKHRQGRLAANEWLTDNDLLALLDRMGLRHDVAVVPFNARDIGSALHFKRQAMEGAGRPKRDSQRLSRQSLSRSFEAGAHGCYTDPYSLSLLLNLGSGGRAAGIHWVSAVIEVDPRTKTVSYWLRDSSSLSAASVKQAQTLLQQAIAYQDGFQTAFPGWAINKAKCDVAGEAKQKDGFSCGYRALHNLVQHPALRTKVDTSPAASQYRRCEQSSKALVEHVYQLLLQTDPRRSLALNFAVKKAGQYRDLVSRLTFPGDLDREDSAEDCLTEDAYLEYLTRLTDQLIKAGERLEKLTLSSSDLTALKGLSTFAAGTALAIDVIELEISAESVGPEYIVALQAALAAIDGATVREVRINDSQQAISAGQWREMIKDIQAKGHSLQVTLPAALRTSPLQKEFDLAVSHNHWHKLGVQAEAAREERLARSQPERAKTKRTRAKSPAQKNLLVDIELQQEQQVEVSSELEKIDLVESEAAAVAESGAVYQWHQFSRFYQNILSGELALSAADKMYSKEQLRALWNHIYGHIELTTGEIKANESMAGITAEALIQLVKHYRQVSKGVAFNHLPKQFILTRYSQGGENIVLHYDAFNPTLRFQASDPLAVKLAAKLQTSPLPLVLIADLMEHFEAAGNEVERSIAAQWRRLEAVEDYDRDAYLIFSQYLPQLHRFSLPELRQLFDLTFSADGQMDKEKFSFLLQNIAKINDSFPARFEANGSPAAGVLSERFPTQEAVVVELAKAVFAASSQQPHLIYSLLRAQALLVEQLQALALTTTQLDAMLHFYHQNGELALTQLLQGLQTIPADILLPLQQALFVTENAYQQCSQPEFAEAIESLTSYSPLQKQWFFALLHKQAGLGADFNLHDLIVAFNAFVRVLEEHHLPFYPLSADSFSSTISLPHALANMVQILENARPDDRELQWQNITRLMFGATGALRAISDAEHDGDRCGILLPEMQVTPSYYHVNNGYRGASNLNTIFSAVTTDEAFEREYYRYIAHCQHRLPVQFYQDALAMARDKAKELSQQDFYKTMLVLLKASTGADVIAHLGSSTEALACWERALSSLMLEECPTKLKLLRSRVTSDFVEIIADLPVLPPLSELTQLARLLLSEVDIPFTINLAALTRAYQAAIKRLKGCQRDLINITRQHGAAIYQGMQFYTEDDFVATGSDSVFYRHLQVTKTILETSKNFIASTDQCNVGMYLVRLISTFNLVSGDELNAMLDNNFRRTARNDDSLATIALLRKMDKQVGREGRVLDIGSLTRFLDALWDRGDRHHFAVLEEHFSDYFPADFFVKLNAVTIPPETEERIDARFKSHEAEIIKTLLARYNQLGDVACYEGLINKLEAIVSSLADEDAEAFFACLAKPGLYQCGAGQHLQIQDFEHLLDAIMARGDASDFFYFLAQAPDLATPGMIAKAVVYLQDLLPGLQDKPKSRGNAIKMPALMAQMVLQSQLAELSAPVADEHYQDHAALLQAHRYLEAMQPHQHQLEELDRERLRDGLLQHEAILAGDIYQTLLAQLDIQKTEVQAEELLEAEEVAAAEETPDEFDKAVAKAKKGWGRFTQFVGKALERKPEPVSELPQAQPVGPEKKKPATLDPSVVANWQQLLAQTEQELGRRRQYSGLFAEVFECIKLMAVDYPGAKTLIQSFMQVLVKSLTEDGSPLLLQTLPRVRCLRETFANLHDENIVRALCNHFNGKEPGFAPANLLAILNLPNFTALPAESQNLVLKMIANLLNDEKVFQADELQQLLTHCADPQHGAGFLAKLATMYALAPYPSLLQVLQWHGEDVMDERYAEFDKAPVERDRVNNGFDLDKAQEQAPNFRGYHFSRAELIELNDNYETTRELTTQYLLEAFAKLRRDPATPISTLLMVLAELLYRSKGQEINTTQYMAIYAMLKTGGHCTDNIGTGEGKSRIMAIMSACGFALGKTVDFATSDVSLVVRDYLKYQSYFTMLGAETNIIEASTPTAAYRKKGINYSDVSSLSLFRNKAKSEGKLHETIHEDEQARFLLLDEADRSYFDIFDTRFNYSAGSDIGLKEMQWVYPLLMRFFNDPVNVALYSDDIDACNEKFIIYARDRCQPAALQQLTALSREQLEAWHDAAITARTLQYEVDYAIEADQEIYSVGKPKIASQARLVSNGRASKEAKFSFGVHQCLHALLNLKKQDPAFVGEGEQPLLQTLAKCKHLFDVDLERQIVISSTSKDLIGDYQQGNLFAVTGTAGSPLERKEAEKFYGNMQFIDVPRDKGLHREDLSLRLARDQAAQDKALAEYIAEAEQKQQPVVIFCENDHDSAELEQRLKRLKPESQFQRIDSRLSPVEEKAKLVEAGKAGMVTLSTKMIGRGTDIELEENAKPHGLKLLLTYLPSTRDLEQMIGRAGRFGAQGDSRLVLNKRQFKQALHKTSLVDGFYTATDTYVKKHQAMLDRKEQCKRLIRYAATDFDHRLSNCYFQNFQSQLNAGDKRVCESFWSAFWKEKDNKWNALWPQLLDEMDPLEPDLELVNRYLTRYQQSVEGLWKQLLDKIESVNQEDRLPLQTIATAEVIKPLALDDQVRELLTEFSIDKIVLPAPTMRSKYDPAHDGFAVLYARPFEETRAWWRGERKIFANTRAWWNHSGILFSGLRAWWRGDISFKQYFTSVGRPAPMVGQFAQSVPDSPVAEVEPVAPSPARATIAGLTLFGRKPAADSLAPTDISPDDRSSSSGDETDSSGGKHSGQETPPRGVAPPRKDVERLELGSLSPPPVPAV